MKVLHVMGKLGLGGTERQLLGMLSAARKLNLWQPHIYLLRAEGQLLPRARDLGMPLWLSPRHLDFDPLRILDLRQFADDSFDVVHSSLWGAGLVSRLALLGRAEPALVLSERRVESFRGKAAQFIDRVKLAQPHMFIGNSTDVCQFISQEYRVPAWKVSRVQNGLDTETFFPPKERQKEHRREDLFTIGCLGRLIALKGFDTVIAAVHDVSKAKRVRLLVAGEGPDRARLERLAAGADVHFLGPLDTPDAVADYLRSLDLFVHASHAEGLPNVVLEARACGVRVVVSDSPGMAEAAPLAPRVAAGDVSALARAITDSLASRGSQQQGLAVASFEDVAREHKAVFVQAQQLAKQR